MACLKVSMKLINRSYLSTCWLPSFLTDTGFFSVLKYMHLSIFIYVCVFCLHVCLHTMCMPGAPTEQKKGLDSLVLELQTVVIQHLCAGNWTHIFWKSSSAPNCWATSPGPRFKKKEKRKRKKKGTLRIEGLQFLLNYSSNMTSYYRNQVLEHYQKPVELVPPFQLRWQTMPLWMYSWPLQPWAICGHDSL